MIRDTINLISILFIRHELHFILYIQINVDFCFALKFLSFPLRIDYILNIYQAASPNMTLNLVHAKDLFTKRDLQSKHRFRSGK